MALRARDIAAEYLAARTDRAVGSDVSVLDLVADWNEWLTARTDIVCNDTTEHLVSPAIAAAGIERRRVKRKGKVATHFMGIRLKG